MLRALRVGDRAGALEAALDAYFGPAVRPKPEDMPPGLAALFTRFEPGLIRQNILARPNDRRVFYIENQSCNEWALADDGADPQVIRDGKTTEQERLCGFAVQIVLFEASMGALRFTDAGYMGRAALARVSEEFVEVPLGRWTWPIPETRFLVAPGVVVHVEEAPPGETLDESWIFVSAESMDRLERVRRSGGITWTGINL
jgi:hypothetical protein